MNSIAKGLLILSFIVSLSGVIKFMLLRAKLFIHTVKLKLQALMA